LKLGKLTAVVVVASIATACNRGLSMQSYFDSLVRIRDEMTAKDQQLQMTAMQKVSEATDDAAKLAALKDYLQQLTASSQRTLGEVKALDPPGDAEQAHQDFVAALTEFQIALGQALQAFDRYTTVDEALGGIMSDAVTKAGADTDKACNALQKIANDNRVKVNLGCASTAGASASPS